MFRLSLFPKTTQTARRIIKSKRLKNIAEFIKQERIIRPNLSEGWNQIINLGMEANFTLRIFAEFDFKFSKPWFRIQRVKCRPARGWRLLLINPVPQGLPHQDKQKLGLKLPTMRSHCTHP